MKKIILLISSVIMLASSCVKDETLVNRVVGEYVGAKTTNTENILDYAISVSGDLNNLTFSAPLDEDFDSFSSTPIVKNSTEIVCLDTTEDTIFRSVTFIFRGDEITLGLIVIDQSLGDTILYGGNKL